MNVKNLRKNYKELSEIERNSLFISAIARNDKSEEAAIMSASPKVFWEKADFAVLFEKVLCLQMIVMIYKADAWTNWQLFGEMESEKADKHSRLALYFFYVYSDAWAAVCKQLKIDAKALAEKTFPDSFLIWRLTFVDEALRELAFTEPEAREFVGQYAATEGKFEMTLENKIKEFRAFLDLPEK